MTTVVLFLVINRAPPKGAARPALAPSREGQVPGRRLVSIAKDVSPPNVAGLLLIALATHGEAGAFKDISKEEAENLAKSGEELFRCLCRLKVMQNADLAQGSQVASAEQPLNDLFTGHVGTPVTSSEANKTLSDPALETGHYDDGHAFGWKVETASQQKDVWTTLTTQFVDEKPAQSVDAVETVAGTDLNNDGATGTGSGSGSGSGCTTGGQTCSASGASCSGGSTCSGQGDTCSGSGTTCSGSGDSCSSGSTCSGPSATCTGAGTQCTQRGDTCSAGASCPSMSPCTGNGTTGSQTLTEPASGSVTYSYYDFVSVIPASCQLPARDLAAYLVSDADGSILACYQDPNYTSPPPGEPACPGNNYSGIMPGDSRSAVLIGNPTAPSGSNVWHIPVSVSYGSGTATPTSAHLVYRWQSG